MKIIRRYKDGNKIDIVKDVKEHVKKKGWKIKDIDRLELVPAHGGIGVSIYGKEGKFITNCLF